jgi:CheY-like chemotaxis protein
MATKLTTEPVVLLIENDEGDVFLFRRALASLNYLGQVRVVGSVSEARDYLEGRNSFANRQYFPLPDLIVSDINLPGFTGTAFLEWMRQDERFKHLPFAFLSGSFIPMDKERAAELGSSGFITKTADIEILRARVASVLKFLPLKKTDPSEPSESTA